MCTVLHTNVHNYYCTIIYNYVAGTVYASIHRNGSIYYTLIATNLNSHLHDDKYYICKYHQIYKNKMWY